MVDLGGGLGHQHFFATGGIVAASLVATLRFMLRKTLPIGLAQGVERRGAPQARQRDCVVFDWGRVDVRFLTHYGRPAAVYLDELAPHSLINCLVVQVCRQVLLDGRRCLLVLAARLVPSIVSLGEGVVIINDSVLDEKRIVGDRSGRQNPYSTVSTAIDLMNHVLSHRFADLVRHEALPLEEPLGAYHVPVRVSRLVV